MALSPNVCAFYAPRPGRASVQIWSLSEWRGRCTNATIDWRWRPAAAALRPKRMRLIPLLVTAILAASPVLAQQAQPSSKPEISSPSGDATANQQPDNQPPNTTD